MTSVRFYCRECNKVMDRRFVRPKAYEEGFKCKWCGSKTFNSYKMLADLFHDFLDYCDKKGIDTDDYE